MRVPLSLKPRIRYPSNFALSSFIRAFLLNFLTPLLLVKHLCADRSLADDVLADVKAGKYMNSVDADGNWVGDALAVNALLAKVGEAQMKAAQQPSRYAWEGGLVKNSGAGDSLADAIAHISD